ncbi:MAG TPA: polysaccharide biosynthesis/export family protein [Pirellulales bacterium]|nr:polysaccharide biosynthesis/export family protein [Pirellulales bacterium]
MHRGRLTSRAWRWLWALLAGAICLAAGDAYCRVSRNAIEGVPYRATSPEGNVHLCQALGPAAPYPIAGLDCATGQCGELGWRAARPIAWQRYAQGEYLGHARLPHVEQYRLRVDDQLDFVFRLTRVETPHAYRLQPGDLLRIESLTDAELTGEQQIGPDGSITMRLLGPVRAARLTVEQLRASLNERYRKFYRDAAITVTPRLVNSKLEDLRSTIDQRFGSGGQSRLAKVTPEGTVQLPVVDSVFVQGLTLAEAQREIEARFAEELPGVEVMPVLTQRAPRYVYVVGEVREPGRYELIAPTTVTQAIALAGGWNYGGNLWKTIVFRRGDDWRLLATMVDLRGSLYGHRPCPADEIWINDSDIVVVPKTALLVAANVLDLVFTQGVLRIVRFNGSVAFSAVRFSGTRPGLLPIVPAAPIIQHPVTLLPSLLTPPTPSH